MPTYEYVCDSCGHAFEEFQSITAKPLRKCPACKKMHLKRLIGTGAGIIFKGSGFYVPDNRAKSSTATPGNVKKADETLTEKSETSSKSDSED